MRQRLSKAFVQIFAMMIESEFRWTSTISFGTPLHWRKMICRTIEFEVKAESNPQNPRVIGDRIQLQQVLLNLITNAIGAMAAKEGIRILCIKSEVRHDGDVEVSVEDTGTGISQQDTGRVFNPLFTTKSDGMGMGLSICRSIVEAHNGRLWVVPNTPEGAVFRFALRAETEVSVGIA